jgi:glycosyltransferase involved in cell wall biosynthesis
VLRKPLSAAWVSDFPVEWLPDVPEPLKFLPRRHPATWQIVLLSEFEKDPSLRTHVILLRQHIERSLSIERDGVTFHVLKAPVWLRVASVFWADTLLIRKSLRKIKPDLVHAWGIEKGAGLIATRLGYPHLMTVQGLLCWYKLKTPLSRYDRFTERLERYSLPRAPVVTTESTFAVRFLNDLYPNLRVQQAEHAPNQAFHRIVRRPQTDPIQFITVGGLGYRKGTDMLFKALEQLSHRISLKLTIITDPTPAYESTLRQSVSADFWKLVEFRRHILPHEVAKELETPTMLLLPTRADTSPNAVKEAVVAGVPVVASSVGGIPDYVIPERNGVLFPPGDMGGFISALETACAHPLFRRGQVEPETQAKMKAYLSPERMALNFLKAYEMVLENPQRGRTPRPD